MDVMSVNSSRYGINWQCIAYYKAKWIVGNRYKTILAINSSSCLLMYDIICIYFSKVQHFRFLRSHFKWKKVEKKIL